MAPRTSVYRCLLSSGCIAVAAAWSGYGASFDDTGADTMKVTVSGQYEIALSKNNGAVLAVRDPGTNTVLTTGSLDGCLWQISFTDQDTLRASSYAAGGAEDFSYSFADSVLTMTYTPSAAGVAVPVTVTLTAHSLGFFDLQLTLTNNSGMTADQVRFPCPMVFDESQATGGFFPDKPGMLFSSEWFTTDLPAEGEHMMIHPPLMADLLGVQMGAGGFAQYAVWGPGPIRMTSLGFRHVEGTTGSLVHDYIVWRPDGYSWESPPVRFRITGDFFESIRAYREDNGIDQFESVSQKLGALYDTVITSPMFAWDGDWFGEYSGWGDFFDRLPKPSVLFMGNYWPGGFHGHHPDLLPPNSVHGTEQELLDALSYARQTGHILASMILPSWWHEESPTIQNLSSTGYTLEDIAEIDAEGRVDYGCWELGGVRDCGYSVSPRAPYVVTRIDRMMNELRDAGFDLLYEDVIGACGFGPDYNASAPDTIDSEKWIDHTRTYQSYGLLTETGYDYLAETQVGFLGGGAGPSWAGAPGGSVRLFPFTGLLLRDKVLQYHYWATPTDSRGALSWNLTFGYMLASRVNPSSPTEGIGGPWHQLIAEFQSRVLSRYATVLMTDFEVLSGGNGVKCEYDTITVVANCDTGESLPYGEHRLPPEGVLVTSASGDLIAGVVDQLNGAPLAPGDHYLIIETDGDTIFVRQPMGGDTRLRLDALAGWAAQDSICVSAWDPDTNLIDAAAVRVQNDTIGFDYRNVVDGQHVAYYKIYKSNTVPAEAWNVFYNDYELPHIVLGNRDWYELYIAKFNGGIAGIVDKTTGDTITIGSNGGILWSVDFPGDPHPGRADPVHGFDELGFAPHKFTYEWDETARTLTLTYARDTTAQYGIDVSVEITISEEPYFDMRIALDNAWGSAQQVDFPYDLLVPSDPGDRYIIPYSYPGLEIDAAFFEGSTAFQAFYPSELLADYAAVVSSAGTMAIYGLHEGDSVSKVALGLARSLDPAQGELPVYRHAYLVDSDSGTSWTSPTLRFRVGQDEMALLAGMRADNGIDAYESASAKLGERFATAARSPLIAVCFENPGDPPFSQIAARLASIRGPAAVMLSGFQQGGMDGHHPCYLPPDNQWGPEEDFTRMIGDLHAQGKMVIPYTRPSWWHANSPTVQGIGSMEAVAQLDESGAPVQQVFGGEETGYRISPYGTGVEDTLARMVRELKGEMGADMLMAARLGSRHDADYNVNAPSHDLYDYGWLETLGAFADSLLIVENGYDRMASPACGFTGSMYDDVSSGSAHWDEIFGAGNWRGYPAGPALLGDKVIAFQPMERSLLSKDMLSFCLLHGMAPSFMPQDGSPDRPYTSPWMRVASVFQAHAGPWTAGQRLVSLTRPTGGVVSADYGDVTVIRNARSSAYASGSHTVAPYGALMVADNGALVAGILTRYNGASLASGDHYLVVTTADSVITVHHPMGAATGLSLPRPAAWSDASQILARAVLTKDSVVEVSATIDEAGVELDLVRSVNGDSVSHFVVTYGGKQSTAARVANPRPAFKLFHSLPNPFHSYTRIRYQVPEEGRVLLRVFDAGGREVRRLVDRVQKPGRYAVVWQADDTRAPLSSGMYLCEIRIGTRRAVRTIMKTK